MKIQYCSDLHLEFPLNRRWLAAHPLSPLAETLVIAGDCFHLGDDYADYDFIRWAADAFEAVYIVPGNHEYHGGYDASTAVGATLEAIQSNVFVANNTAVEIQGVRLIFSTMWSLIYDNAEEITRRVTDFRRIRYQGERFTVSHFNTLHEHAFRFLKEEVAKAGKKLVVTHHLPSDQCNIEAYRGSPINPAFCVDYTDFISASDIDAWIYGHSHRNLPEFEIGGTRMLTNQLGYVMLREHNAFKGDKVVEVDINP